MSLFKPYKHEKSKLVALVYGRPGCGKTSLLAALNESEFGKVALLDLEDGKGKVVPEGVLATDPVQSLMELAKAHKELKAGIDDVNTLVVDGFSAVIDMCLKHITKDTGKMLEVPNTNVGVWGKRNALAFRQFDKLRTLPFQNIFFTCGEMWAGPDGGVQVCKPQMSEGVSDKVSHYLDALFRLEVKPNGGRRLHIAASATIQSKTRNPALTGKFGKHIDLPKPGEPNDKFLELLREL